MKLSANKSLYEVEIAGVPLKLLSEHSEDLVQEMIGLVDAKVGEALASSKTQSIQSSALLAALNIAEELILLRSSAREQLDQLSHRTESILQQLESSSDQQVEV